MCTLLPVDKQCSKVGKHSLDISFDVNTYFFGNHDIAIITVATITHHLYLHRFNYINTTQLILILKTNKKKFFFLIYKIIHIYNGCPDTYHKPRP